MSTGLARTINGRMDVFNMVKSITCQLLIIFGLFHLHSCRVVISSTPSIKTNSGKVVGEISVYSIGAVAYFFGIPYARPPVGDLRFSKPQPVERWNDILNATQQVSYCYEPVTSARFVHRKYSEDCLTLSIAVPVKALNEPGTRPVIIDLGRDLSLDTYHGYLTEFYPLVVKQDLILVRVSCRRNIFGYAYTKANDGLDGNYALYDQNMAFEWIKNNIKNFGGNPQKITIFGNSAAAQLVTAHILSPYSRGMFQNAIVQSGTFQTLNDNKQLRVDEATNIVIERVGCKKARNVLDCLRQKKPQDLIDALPRRFAAFEPVPASDYIPYTSEQIISYSRGKKFTNELNINILAGYSQGEASVLLSAIAPNIFADAELTKEDADDVMEMLFTPQAIEKITEIYIGDINQPLSIRKIQNGLTKLINDIIITCPLVSTAYGTSICKFVHKHVFSTFFLKYHIFLSFHSPKYHKDLLFRFQPSYKRPYQCIM